MFLSKRSNGIYYVFYQNIKGKRTCISTKEKIKSEALKFLNNFEKKINEKKDQSENSISLKEFSFYYRKYSEVHHRPKTSKSVKSIFNQLIDYAGNINISQISPQTIDNYLQYKSNVSLYTAQKHLAYLRSAFNKAVKDKLIFTNPFNSVTNFKLPERQPKFFDVKSFNKLIKIIKEKDFRDIIIFAVNTGLRQMELITLEWDQINFDEKFLILNNQTFTTKNKKVRSLPLNSNALQILNKRKRNNTQNVFTFHGEIFKEEYLRKKFKKYILKAGLNPKLNFHSLRHTFASWLVQKGVSILVVSKLLGHSDIKTTQIYSHLRIEDLHNAIKKLED